MEVRIWHSAFDTHNWLPPHLVQLISCNAEAVQEKLLSDYEAEIKNESKKPSHSKKDSNASDDWEKLSDDASSKWPLNGVKAFLYFCRVLYLQIEHSIFSSPNFCPALLNVCRIVIAESKQCITIVYIVKVYSCRSCKKTCIFWRYANCGAYISYQRNCDVEQRYKVENKFPHKICFLLYYSGFAVPGIWNKSWLDWHDLRKVPWQAGVLL